MKIYRPAVTEFETPDVLFKDVEDFLVDRVFDAIAQNGSARIALSGGKTPLPLYSRISLNPILEWDKIEIYQTDERYVAPTDPESNQFNIAHSLDLAVKEAKEWNFFNTKLPIEMTIKECIEKLETLDGPYFDLTILGVGPDGHIASLFPNGKYLKHQEKTVIETSAPKDFSVTKRISLTVESILNSKEIFLIITGDNKSDILSEMLEGEKSAVEFPAKFLLAHPNLRIFQCLA